MKSGLSRNIIFINLIAVTVLAVGVLFLSNYRAYLERSEYKTLTVYLRIITDKILSTKTIRKIPTNTRNTVNENLSFGYINNQNEMISFDADDDSFSFVFDKTALTRIAETIFTPDINFYIFDNHGKILTANNTNTFLDKSFHLNPLLTGIRSRVLDKDENGNLTITDSLYYHNKIIGALTVVGGKENINKALTDIRKALFVIFCLSLAINFLLFLYLTRKITSPLFYLAKAANLIAAEKRYNDEIPDYSSRNDEIGELSMALRKMVDTLWQRLMATENFASDISHEIKNPLSSLRSAAETITKLHDNEKRDAMALIIRNDIIRLDKLVNEISALSKLDRELAKEENEEITVSEFLLNIAEIKKIGNENLNIICNTDEVNNIAMKINSVKLAQIFDNLITNAMSFGNNISIYAGIKKNHLIIRVDDDGPGIPPECLKKIFERFYSSRPKGNADTHSGLGLAISQKIAKAMNGKIFALNRKPKGASFIVVLSDFYRK